MVGGGGAGVVGGGRVFGVPPSKTFTLPAIISSSEATAQWMLVQVGCMGFCMGGALTLSVSQSGKIDCGVPCYGLPSEGHGEVSTCIDGDKSNVAVNIDA